MRYTARAMSRHDTRVPGLSLLLVAAMLGAGCSQFPFSAAWNPEAAAPPSAAAPWRTADGNRQPRMATLLERRSHAVRIDPDKEYRLADLIDLAQRIHPDTQRAWEEARAAAAPRGRAGGARVPALEDRGVGRRAGQ